MTRTEFLDKIFSFFCYKSDESLKPTYDLALSVEYKVDWDKLFEIVINEAETRSLPVPKWFTAKIPKCRIYDSKNPYPLEGTNIIVTWGKKFINEEGEEIEAIKTYPFIIHDSPETTFAEFEINLKNKFRKQGKEVKNIVFMES